MEYGSSSMGNISTIMDILWKLQPDTILDVGCGNGKYGFLIREYLTPKKLDAIEIYEVYLTKVQEAIYDTIYKVDALEHFDGITKIEKYDVILLVDILEHFEEDDAKGLLEDAYTYARTVIASVPRDNAEQGALGNNKHQKHRYQWTPQDFRCFTKRCSRVPSKSSYIFVLGDNWFRWDPIFRFISLFTKGWL